MPNILRLEDRKQSGNIPLIKYQIDEDGNPILTRRQTRPTLEKHDSNYPIFGYNVNSYNASHEKLQGKGKADMYW